MQVFAYRAVNRDGELITAELASEGAAAAREIISQQGLTLVELRQRRTPNVSHGRGHESAETLIEFTSNLANLLSAGIPILQVLEDLEEQSDRNQWRRRVHDVRQRIEAGSTVSEALAGHPEVFSEMYVNLVAAGEESGQLAETLRRLAAHLEWRRSLAQQVREATSYPLLVLGAMALLIGLLTFFVFPRLTGVFAALDVSLPIPTRVLLSVGHFGARSWPYALAALPVIALGVAVLRRLPAVRAARDRVVLRIPIIGRVGRLVLFSRFSSSLATLISSGVPLGRALQLTEQAIGNSVVAQAVLRTRERIEGGATLAEALTNTGGFPQLLVRMVRVGESSGDLAAMLQNSNEYFEREIPRVIRKAMAACSPALIVLMGALVTWIALSIFLPLLQLGSAIR